MTSLLLMLLSQSPTPTVIADPSVQSKRVTTTTSGGKQLLDVNVVLGGGGSGSSSGTLDGGFVGVSSLPIVFVGDAGVLNVNPVAIASMPVLFIGDAGTLNVNLPPGAATSAKQDTAIASLANLDVALSTRTKPADQQHVIIDSSAGIAVTLATAPSTPITAATLPLPTGASTDATLSGLLDGGVGLLSTIAANQTSGNERVTVIMMQYPLNPFLPRCNPVRRTGCQP